MIYRLCDTHANGVVHYQWDTGIMSDLCYLFKVRNIKLRISNDLYVDGTCLFGDGLLELFRLRSVAADRERKSAATVGGPMCPERPTSAPAFRS